MNIDINKTKTDDLSDKKIIIICEKCKKRVLIYKFTISKKSKHYYCSTNCKNEHQKIIMLSKNNPNYNNRWSDEQKQQQSIKIKK